MRLFFVLFYILGSFNIEYQQHQMLLKYMLKSIPTPVGILRNLICNLAI